MIDDYDKEEIVHVQRPPLPWRANMRTECGLPPSGHSVISRDEFVAKLKDQGQRRAAMTTCMTCFDTAMRHPSWEQDPVGCIARDIGGWRPRNDAFKRELRALAALATRHRDEFDELMKDQEEIVPLKQNRTERKQRTKW